MVTYKWEDLRGDNLPFGGQIAKGVRGFACNLWNKYPDKLAYGENPLLSPAKFFWNIVCAEEGVNRQPNVPFQGGQCPNVFYRIALFITYQSGVNENYTSGSYSGPISDVYIAPTPSNGDGVWVRYGTQNPQQTSVVRSNVSSNPVVAFDVTSVIRADGLADNCGSLPSTWRPILPPPQSGDETWNVDINDGDDVSLDIPLTWVDVNFEMPLTFNFEVGDIVVDVGGVTINFNDENEWNVNERSPEAADREFVSEDNDRIRDDIEREIEDFREKYEEDKRPPDLEDFDEETEEDVEEKEETDPEIQFVIITLTQSPKKGKTILLSNPDDNVYFIGYFAWTFNGARSIEVPVRKSRNVFKKPDWANGYAFYTVNNAKATVSTFTTKLTPEG